MATHRLASTSGATFQIVVGDDGRISDVVGEWPEKGGTFELVGPLPAHSPVEEVPDHVRSLTAERQLDEVCFYDGDGCRTCWCDANGHMHCKAIC